MRLFLILLSIHWSVTGHAHSETHRECVKLFETIESLRSEETAFLGHGDPRLGPLQPSDPAGGICGPLCAVNTISILRRRLGLGYAATNPVDNLHTIRDVLVNDLQSSFDGGVDPYDLASVIQRVLARQGIAVDASYRYHVGDIGGNGSRVPGQSITPESIEQAIGRGEVLIAEVSQLSQSTGFPSGPGHYMIIQQVALGRIIFVDPNSPNQEIRAEYRYVNNFGGPGRRSLRLIFSDGRRQDVDYHLMGMVSVRPLQPR